MYNNYNSSEKLAAILFDDRIELIPLKPIKDLRGVLKGMDTNINRESDG